jgi:pimeloyl-ACP methyl ester carboxylesterase
MDVNGIGIAYEIIGEGPRNVAVSGAGRYSKDRKGVPELARGLADEGCRVLIWDKINTGESDISFEGENESLINVDALAGLIKGLDFGPALLVGGSAGSRLSLLLAMRNPELVSGLFLFWISGGAIGLAGLANFYYYESALAAVTGGMEKVAALPTWEEQIRRNPGNRERILAQDPMRFVDTMQRWAWAFFPKSEAPVPGLTPEDLAAVKVPAVVLRSGNSDLFHTRATSEALAQMLPNADLQLPPWGEDEWNEGGERGTESGEHPCGKWPLLVPQIMGLVRKL